MRRISLATLAALLLLSSCTLGGLEGSPQATPTLPEPTVRTVQAPDPEAAARAYLDAWREGEYGAMYQRLSPLSQDGITQEDFTSRHQEFMQKAAVNRLEYEVVSSLLNPQSAQVRYRLTLKSAVVGDVVRETWMDLTRVDGEWRIGWSESMIMPELAGGNGVEVNLVTPPRANIYDLEGQALATTGEIVALWIVPNQIGGEDAEEAMLGSLSRLLDRRAEAIQDLYDDIRERDWRVPLGEVSLQEFQQEQGVLANTGGVQWGTYEGRFYLDQGLAPHAVGYVGQIQQEQLDQYLQQGYPRDAFIGQIGLEFYYEEDLRGEPGGTLYLTDLEGNRIEILAEREFQPPYAAYTNLDRELQRHTRNALQGFSGAAVVLNKDTGAVLAMASSPDFDPNLFDWRNPNSTEGLSRIFEQNQPLVNRATTGVYPLGSLFKIVTMAAALDSDRYSEETIYDCGWEFNELQGVTLYDWTLEKELPPQGEISLVQGLSRSCNPYFYHIGLDLFSAGMPAALSDMARQFGLGEETGIEIDEGAGFIPGPDNLPEGRDRPWAARDNVTFAIGQSEMLATPIQTARYVAAVGNGGTLYRPQLINRLENAVGDVRQPFEPEVQGTLPIDGEQLAAIQRGMVNVIRADRGTARRQFLGLNLNIAGKTGTAQTGNEFTDPHSWFGAYTFEERENTPDIAVVVILENQGEGSEWAAPVARRIIEAHFFDRPISVFPWESQIGVPREETPTPEGEEAEEDGTPEPSND